MWQMYAAAALLAVAMTALQRWHVEHRAAVWQRVMASRLTGYVPRADAALVDELEAPYVQRVIWPKLMRGRAAIARRITPANLHAEMDNKLRQAGIRQSAEVFFLSRLAWASAALLVAALAALWERSLPLDLRIAGPVLVALVAYTYPSVHLNTRVQQRLEEIDRGLPEVFDLLSVSVEAGLAFDGALKTVSMHASGAARDEFARVLADMQLGVPRAEALAHLAQRTHSAPLKRFAGLVAQSDRTGSGVGAALKVQAKDIKEYRAAKAREKAASLPVKILFPMILFIFPAMFMIILGPAVISASKLFHL